MTETEYNFLKIPKDDMDLLMKEIIWDESRPLNKDIEKAMWNIEYISKPWIVFSFEAETPTQALIFVNEESAKAYVAENNQDGNLVCLISEFYSPST